MTRRTIAVVSIQIIQDSGHCLSKYGFNPKNRRIMLMLIKDQEDKTKINVYEMLLQIPKRTGDLLI
jgi:hypothetical protein